MGERGAGSRAEPARKHHGMQTFMDGKAALGPESIEGAIHFLLEKRGPGKSVCPSEVARFVAGEAGDWRALMPEVRVVARALLLEGKLRVTQRGIDVDPGLSKGPIRLSLKL